MCESIMLSRTNNGGLMLTSKKIALKPLLESADGIHLTAYLVNRGKLMDLKAQLRDSIEQAYEWLNPVMSVEDRNRFLEPLDNLLEDSRIFKQMNGNIGIFRNQDTFRILNIPVEVEQTCQVATSFHIKPLLKWLQTDQEFLLLGLEAEAAHLYLGSQDSLKLVDSILFPELFKNDYMSGDYSNLKKARQKKIKEEETFTWLNEWISELTQSSKPKLFLAGEKSLIDSLNQNLTYKNTIKTPMANFFDKNNINDICSSIRKILKVDSRASLEKTLMEFRFAEEDNRTRKNIFQIAKAVVQGRVKKLIVSDELSIFGKIDKKSGGLAIHPFDLDHEDDDILDDLAQMVLSQGGEVIVASRNEIPKGRPILAILEDDGNEIKKLKKRLDLNLFKRGRNEKNNTY
jgi:hypothetical protein